MIIRRSRLMLLLACALYCLLVYVGLIYAPSRISGFCVAFSTIVGLLAFIVYFGRRLGADTLFR
jgi:hypothetical protein